MFFLGVSRFHPTLRLTWLKMSEIILTGRKTQKKKNETKKNKQEFQIKIINGPRQANLVLIAYASSEGSGEPAHPHSLARTSAARSYKH